MERQLTLTGSIVKKSNALARARWGVESVYEPRLVALAASRVRQDDDDFQSYQIPVQEILGLNPGGHACKLLEKVVTSLLGRIITIKDRKGWIKYTLFSKCRYDKESGILEVEFHPDLRPHYLSLRRNFMQYELMEFFTLPTIYSQLMFELLCSWSDKPEVTIPLEELYEYLDASPNLRARFPDFRRDVLNRAYKHINTTTSLSFAWEPIKKGRKVVAIRFTFSPRRMSESEAKAKGEQDQRESQEKNTLFLAATKCLQGRGGACENPEGKQECSVCLPPN